MQIKRDRREEKGEEGGKQGALDRLVLLAGPAPTSREFPRRRETLTSPKNIQQASKYLSSVILT